MARIRTIKPEFWGDEKLAPMDPLTRLVFLGLISMADDAGRLLDSVKLIDGTLFAMTNDTSREALANLSRAGRIARGLTASGQNVIQINGWRHQKVDHPNIKAALPPISQEVTELSRAARESVAKETAVPRDSTSTSDLRPTATNPAQKSAPWLGHFATAWLERYDGKMPTGPSVGPLRKLVNANGEDETFRRWVIYLAATEGSFASAARFAATWGEWSGERPTIALRPFAAPRLSKQEVGRAHLQTWLDEKAAAAAGVPDGK